jgi:hypothetical protein
MLPTSRIADALRLEIPRFDNGQEDEDPPSAGQGFASQRRWRGETGIAMAAARVSPEPLPEVDTGAKQFF